MLSKLFFVFCRKSQILENYQGGGTERSSVVMCFSTDDRSKLERLTEDHTFAFGRAMSRNQAAQFPLRGS